MAVLADIRVSEPRAGVAVVEIGGEHDLVTQAELDHVLSRLIRDNDLVVVDISKATFVDSWFIRGLVVANEDAADHGTAFRVQMGTAHIVRRAIEISRIGQAVEFVISREDALAQPDHDDSVHRRPRRP